jgi:hypothetical protein
MSAAKPPVDLSPCQQWARSGAGERPVHGNTINQISGSRYLPFVHDGRWLGLASAFDPYLLI